MANKPEVKKALVSQNSTSLAKPRPLWTDQDKAAFAVVMGQIFDVQKLYGKNVGQLGSAVELFAWVLSKYPVEKVIWGIGEYIGNKSDLPTPADIRQIIDPDPPKKEWDKSVYIKLQQIFKTEGPYGLNSEEYEYIRGYEENVLRTHRSTT